MITYHCDTNVTLHTTLKFQQNKDCIKAYNSIMRRLQYSKHVVMLQVIDKEASAEYKRVIEEDWNYTYQLVPPDFHRRNSAERAIRTFKGNFLAILDSINPSLPKFLWDKLLPQTELTLNLLHQSTLKATLSDWEHFDGSLNFDAYPLGPLGCRVIIHNNPSTQKTWDFCGREGFNVIQNPNHYRCFQVVDQKTKALVISNTVEFRH